MAIITTDDKHYKRIADAIRDNTSNTDLVERQYLPEEMGNYIEQVYAEQRNIGYDEGRQNEYDAFWDAFQQNGKRDYYSHAFAGGGWSQRGMLKPKYPILVSANNSNAAMGLFYYFNRNYANATSDEPYDLTEFCKMCDLSTARSGYMTFCNARAINITCDFSNATDMSNTFACGDGGYIDNVTLKISEKCVRMNNVFYYARYLTTLTFIEGSVIAVDMNVQYSPLTHDSLMNIINALKDVSDDGVTRTLTIGSENYAKLTQEEIAIAETKGWNVA